MRLTLLQDDTEIVPVSVTDNGDDTYTVVTDVISDVTGAALSVTLTDTAGNVSRPLMTTWSRSTRSRRVRRRWCC